MMDRRSWCAECQEWVDSSHTHNVVSLSLPQKAAAYSMGVKRILHHGDSPMNVEPEELTEALESESEGDLDSDLMSAAYKYIHNNLSNISKTARMIAGASQDLVQESLLRTESKTNGNIGVGGGMIKDGRRVYNLDEDYGYDQDDDLEIR